MDIQKLKKKVDHAFDVMIVGSGLLSMLFGLLYTLSVINVIEITDMNYWGLFDTVAISSATNIMTGDYNVELHHKQG
jgi:hypothetical protein